MVRLSTLVLTSLLAAAAARAADAAAAGVEVHEVRLNAQRPEWSNACPPPEDGAAPCMGAGESQGLPSTGLRLTWELRGAADQRVLVQRAYEAEITCVLTGRMLWQGNGTSSSFAALALPEPELPLESSFGARVRVSWVSAAAAGAPAWTDWSAPALFDTAPSSSSWAARDSEWIGGHNSRRRDCHFAAPPLPLYR